MSQTVLAKTAELAWALLESNKINPLPIFRAVRIDPKLMRNMNARVTQSTMNELWKRVADAIDDPCFGLQAGKLWHPAYMHALGYAWMSSSTLRTALARLVRFIRIVNQTTEIHLSETADELSISWGNAQWGEPEPWHADATLSVIMAMCRANYGENLNPVCVSIAHPKPDCAGDFFAYFRCPVEFSAAQDLLVLSIPDIDKQLPSSNPLMSQVHDQIMVKYLADLDDSDIVERVKASIIDQLPNGRLSDIKVAESLFMSNRTLQRKLQARGTSFKTILTEVRKKLAMTYIGDSQLTLTELSFQLGFSEMSAFSRAFKQWTGESPREFRQAL